MIEVYWNLHRRMFSVRVNGLVQGRHRRHLALRDAAFVVSEQGRERVRASMQKNVHAWVRGKSVPAYRHMSTSGWTRIEYDPYRFDQFIRSKDGAPVVGAEMVMFRCSDGEKRHPIMLGRGVQLREVA
jgi:hypothetical protein